MTDLVFKNYTTQRAPGRGFFKKVLEIAVKEIEKLGNEEIKIGVSINLVGEAKIKELNKKYRNKNKSTDVLSFPINAYNGLTISADGQTVNDIGDIFICLSIAKKEAKRENISIEQKLAQLTVHGFLHLQDYDHERSKRSAEKMFKLENQILGKFSSYLKL